MSILINNVNKQRLLIQLLSVLFNEIVHGSEGESWIDRRQEECRLEEEFDKDAVYHQFCSTCIVNALPRNLWTGLETSKQEGKIFKL
jgi:hypothetical protein